MADVWGSEESLESMNAFVKKRNPDFQNFRRATRRWSTTISRASFVVTIRSRRANFGSSQ